MLSYPRRVEPSEGTAEPSSLRHPMRAGSVPALGRMRRAALVAGGVVGVLTFAPGLAAQDGTPLRMGVGEVAIEGGGCLRASRSGAFRHGALRATPGRRYESSALPTWMAAARDSAQRPHAWLGRTPIPGGGQPLRGGFTPGLGGDALFQGDWGGEERRRIGILSPVEHLSGPVEACSPARLLPPAPPLGEAEGGASVGEDAARAHAPRLDGRDEVVVGSEIERYLRTLQVGGGGALYPWSLRGLSPREVDRLLPGQAHPWSRRFALRNDSASGFRAVLLRPTARIAYNSGFPYGMNDGPVWAGRGVTAAARAGAALRAGPLSLRVEPVLFWAENRDFELMPTGRSGRLAYADGSNPGSIDLPQRFGDGAYTRLDPGESTLRLDALGLAAGVSTAAQSWGPADDLPMLLGNNAGGFAHAFAGTSVPVRTPLGRVHGRVIWGRLEQSDYSVVEGPASLRYATGFVGVFSPRGIEGLEIGAARFFHVEWPANGVRELGLLKAFEGITKASLDETGQGSDNRSADDNQLASVFARWVVPTAGLEFYGEYGREDHNWDLLDLALEPDHQSGYTLGFRKVWRSDAARMVSVRGEVQNTQPSHLARVRQEGPLYSHFALRQGHTHRGQLLASPFGYGGGGSVFAADVYRPWGRWSVAWTRGRLGEQGRDFLETGTVHPRGTEVVHSLGGEVLLFRRRLDLSAGVTGSANLNRHFNRDAYNLSVHVGARAGL